MPSPRFSSMIVHMTASKLEEGKAQIILMIAPIGPDQVAGGMATVPVESRIIPAIDLIIRPAVTTSLIGAGRDQSRIGLEEAMVRMTVLIMTAAQPVGPRAGESNVGGAIPRAAPHG